MEHPSMFPTSSDYANSSADRAREETARLAQRVASLELVVKNLQQQIALMARAASQKRSTE